LLKSIKQFTDYPYEVLILADTPSKKTTEFLNTQEYNFDIVYNGDLYLTWNTGLKKIQTDFVCFLTSDCVVSPGWLTSLMKYAMNDNFVTCWTIDEGNGFWGDRRLHYDCGDIDSFDMQKFVDKVKEIKKLYNGKVDCQGWFVPWLVNTHFFTAFGGWQDHERHPASMDEFTYQDILTKKIPFIRALDAGVYHFS